MFRVENRKRVYIRNMNLFGRKKETNTGSRLRPASGGQDNLQSIAGLKESLQMMAMREENLHKQVQEAKKKATMFYKKGDKLQAKRHLQSAKVSEETEIALIFLYIFYVIHFLLAHIHPLCTLHL